MCFPRSHHPGTASLSLWNPYSGDGHNWWYLLMATIFLGIYFFHRTSFLFISGHHGDDKAYYCCPCKKLMPFHKLSSPFLLYTFMVFQPYFFTWVDVPQLITHDAAHRLICLNSCAMTGIKCCPVLFKSFCGINDLGDNYILLMPEFILYIWVVHFFF